MKKNKGLLIIFILALLALVWYLFKKDSAEKVETKDATIPPNTDAKGDKMKGYDHVPKPFVSCFEIPTQFPRYDNAAVPSATMELLNAKKVKINGMSEARVRGFFKAIDVAPSAGAIISYIGAAKVWEYLNSQDGQLPYDLVVLGASRCQNVQGLTYLLV